MSAFNVQDNGDGAVAPFRSSVGLPTLIRPAVKEVRSRVYDSARWASYLPREDDIIIATSGKSGTTWMQHIVSMLVFQSAEPRSLSDVSPWPDARFIMPALEVWARAEAQTHRRFFKTHLALDLLPLYEGVRYIHVARDGRDVAMSLYNHRSKLSDEALAARDAVSLKDPKFGDRYPRVTGTAAEFFQGWLDADPAGNIAELSFFHVERSFWDERARRNILLVHFNDLKTDLAGEIDRIAQFLDAPVQEPLRSELVEAAGFNAMKAARDLLMPPSSSEAHWGVDTAQFLFKGTNGRWQDALSPPDLAAYDKHIRSEFSPDLARWVEHGRLIAGDPSDTP